MATAISTKTNGPAANKFRNFSVNNKATKPLPADPVPVIPVRVALAVLVKVALAALVKVALAAPVREAVGPVVQGKAVGPVVRGKVIAPRVQGKVIAPDLAGPVRAVSPEAVGDNLLATHWQQYSMQMAMV